MALRSVRGILSQGIPEYPEEKPTWQSLAQDVLAEPMIAPFRLFWHNFLEARPWWPVLVPLMLWVGWRSYRRERRKYFAEQRKLAAKRAVTLIQ
ncbi:MAG TPA: hypothetical protein VFT66_07640 [Roseiflexaceae bacterium]|jgi:hypothetical protein|nr:hypothetical protein [Roseiflexaceae bacterium]